MFVNDYSIRLLAPDEAYSFRKMTYGRYKPFLAWVGNAKGDVFPVGLFKKDVPAGLLLAFRHETSDEADILSLFIEKEHRGKGLSKKMLNLLEDSCRERGAKSLKIFYLSDRPFVPILENLLSKSEFSAPKPEAFICKCDRSFANLSMLDYTQLPEGYETFPWMSLPFAKREELMKQWTAEDWFDERLSPFGGEDMIVSECSLGLRCGDEVIGWTVCHMITVDTIQYTTLFIKPEIQGVGIGVALQMRSLRAHLLTSLLDRVPYGQFIVRYDNKPRLKVAKNRFAKYSIESYDQVICTKTL